MKAFLIANPILIHVKLVKDILKLLRWYCGLHDNINNLVLQLNGDS